MTAEAEAEANNVESKKSEDGHCEDMNLQHVDGAIPRQTRHLNQSGGRMRFPRTNRTDALRTTHNVSNQIKVEDVSSQQRIWPGVRMVLKSPHPTRATTQLAGDGAGKKGGLGQ